MHGMGHWCCARIWLPSPEAPLQASPDSCQVLLTHMQGTLHEHKSREAVRVFNPSWWHCSIAPSSVRCPLHLLSELAWASRPCP